MARKIFLLDHFLSLFDTVAHPIAVTEASGEILYANTEFEEMTTLGMEIVRGMCIDNLFPAEHKRKIAASLAIASNQDNDFVMREHKIYIRRKSRRLVPVDLSMSKIQIDHRNLLIFSFSDLTMVDQMQKEREQTQIEMLHLSRLADIGRLSAGIAHELNNPLQVVMGLAENIKELVDDQEFSPDKFYQQLNPLLGATNRMAQIILNMMKMARQEKVEIVPENLRTILDSSFTILQGSIDKYGIKVDIKFSSDVVVHCNANQMEQVFINLFANALDSMIEKGGDRKLLVEVAETPDDVHIDVTNTGVSIPEEIQNDIMSPFFTTKSAGKGVGLGLFVSFGIVQAHGGQLRLIRSDDDLTTFRITLPKATKVATSQAS